MAIADDLLILDEWSKDEPQEAATFAAALVKRYGKPLDDSLLEFAIEAPDVYQRFVTRITARYTKSSTDVQREVGRAVLNQAKGGVTLQAARNRFAQAGLEGLTQAEREALAAAGDLEINVTGETQAERNQRVMDAQRNHPSMQGTRWS